MKMLWLTNIPTPYRIPLWRELAQVVELRVACLAKDEPNRSWDADQLILDSNAKCLKARALRKTYEHTLYAPTISLVRLALSPNIDVIIIDGWESPAYILTLILRRAVGRATVISYRGTIESRRYSKGIIAAARSRIFGLADAILTGSAESTKSAIQIGVDPARIVQGPNVIDVDYFHQRSALLRASRSETGHRFVVVGQLIARKNVEAAISAFASIRAPGDTLRIVGDGPMASTLEAHAKSLSLDLDSEVIFVGNKHGDELIIEYANASTLVLPSHQEVWGLVVAEALATGAHAVVSRTAGCVGTVADMSGVYIAGPEVAELAAAMSSSRAHWRGHLSHPEILVRNTPQESATKAVDVALLALKKSRLRRHSEASNVR